MELTKLPFPMPGIIYRSAMPYSSYDPEGKLIPAYLYRGISMVIMLSSDEENLRVSGQNLRAIYKDEGLDILHLPIPDFRTPALTELRETVRKAIDYSKTGKGSVIHCHAGVGRTGMFAACMAKMGMDYSNEEAINWVRDFIPGAIEVPEQELIIRLF